MPGLGSRMARGLRCGRFCRALGAGAAAAQPPPEAEAQWRALIVQAEEAYRRGAYTEGAAAAERALALARQALGPAHPSTLASTNSLANVYLAQGRLGEAEPLHSQDHIDLLGGFGFADFDINRNGVLDDADVGVTVANGNTVLDFAAYGDTSTLTVIGVTNLGVADFADVV